MAVPVVLVAVLLNVGAAVVLKLLADESDPEPWLLLGGIATAVALAGARFVVWGYAHRRYPLSLTYPLSSLFFPAMLGVSYLFGEPVTGWKVAGTALITTGVLWLALRVSAPAAEEAAP